MRDCNQRSQPHKKCLHSKSAVFSERGRQDASWKHTNTTQEFFQLSIFFHQKITETPAFHLRVHGTILIKAFYTGSRQMTREPNPSVASCPAIGCWERRARFEAKPLSVTLRPIIWTSASHNPEETALTLTQPLLQARDTSLSSAQPTHLELCTVLFHGCTVVFTWNEAEMGKAGFGPVVVAGTGSHLTAKASLCRSWVRFSNMTHARAVSNTFRISHPSCCKRRNEDPVIPCTPRSGQNMRE